MKTNFDISLPTIPGKLIKFKIQDIKQTAFGSQKTRFNQNKNTLTKKFIQSFSNFHHPIQKKQEEETDAQSKSNSRISHITKQAKETTSFRHIVPEQRKYLLSVYETYKDHQVGIFNNQSKQKGFSFNKVPKQLQNSFHQISQKDEKQKKFVTDNYYFTSSLIRKKRSQSQQKRKKEKPSAVFKYQTRNRVYSRIYNSQVPGPGFYNQNKNQPKEVKNIVHPEIKSKSNQLDFKKLKQIINNIVISQQQQPEQNLKEEKQAKLQHMFIIDDRDRFGEQKYPIAPKLNVPGPGSYSIADGIQDKAKKIVIVQQQRKLLKQWFNN